MVIKLILYILAFITALPVGILLSKLCTDELIYPRKYFNIMIGFLIALAIIFLISYRDWVIILSTAYMILIFSVLLWKGRKAIKKRKG